MRSDLEKKLAERIHVELRQLPLVKAPPTLVPRVRAAIEARAHCPWWKRSWSEWPRWCRALVLVAGLSVAFGLSYGAWYYGPSLTLSVAGEVVRGWLSPFKFAGEALLALANAAVVLVRTGGQLVLWTCLLVAGVIYLVSVGLGTVCYRLALNRL
jgi:hypothetical protein